MVSTQANVGAAVAKSHVAARIRQNPNPKPQIVAAAVVAEVEFPKVEVVSGGAAYQNDVAAAQSCRIWAGGC